MDYKNMAQHMMGNPYLSQQERFAPQTYQTPFQGQAKGWAAIQGPRPGNMMGGYVNVPQGGQSAYPKNEVDLRAIINQILQGMQRPPRLYGPGLQNEINNPMPDNAG